MKRYFYIFGIILFLYCNNYITAQIREKEITLEDIFLSNKFAIKSLRSVTWLKSGEAYLYLYTDTSKKQTDIWKYNVKTGSQEVFIDASKLDTQAVFRIQNYILSPDESKILFTGVLPARSVKSGGNIFLYDLKNKTFKQLTNTESEQVNIKFSPDGKYIGFVRDNNIFIIDTFTFKETQLTFDGGKHILNGKFDWVYEEEWSIIDGWSWSFDSRYIAYWQLDESQVPEFPLIDYTKTPVGIKNIRYPKAGEKNSSVKIGVIDIHKGTNQWFDLGQEEDSYIPRIFWMPNNNKLAIFKVNRLQNKLGIFEADPMTAKTRKLLEENSESWVDVEQSNYFFLKNGSFIFTSERSGYNHIYISTFDKKIETKQITKGEYDVIKILSIDEKKGVIYFTSTEKSPLERHLYSVDFAGKKVKRITEQDGTHSINISPNFKYYIDTYSNANTVPKIILCSIDGKLIRTIEENNIPAFGEYKIGRKEFFQFKTSDNIELNGWMIKPVDFNPEKKYPVLIYVYGGPGSQTVLDQWDRNNLWYTLLTQKGYIIVSVDGRGTGARGAKFKKIVYKNLGKWETNDQIETAKYLSNLSFVDKNRIGIWGWSYGGYMALMSILLGNEIFKTAVAVAPVTDWKYYDTIYTERYMQTPELNPDGYKESSVLNYADRLKGKLLVIHGTDDDNVHWQNTISLANEFQKYNKQFLTMFYPGKDHSIAGGVTRLHLYTLMTNFIIENL
ncbi:MAG: Dipeptidyl peptidase IV [Ignavibacteriae bacterium]|nr:MAG: Dipeptidyl peptidase IV [Ignavibacteriota bacterium]